MSARIKVLGIGGAGNNVVNRMVGVVNGVEFVAVNTDTQDLAESLADVKLAIGEKTTKGLGSGGDPSIGQRSAEESFDTIKETLRGTDLVFITAGMGGGTGTGAQKKTGCIVARLPTASWISVLYFPRRYGGCKQNLQGKRRITTGSNNVGTQHATSQPGEQNASDIDLTETAALNRKILMWGEGLTRTCFCLRNRIPQGKSRQSRLRKNLLANRCIRTFP